MRGASNMPKIFHELGFNKQVIFGRKHYKAERIVFGGPDAMSLEQKIESASPFVRLVIVDMFRNQFLRESYPALREHVSTL